MKNQSKETSFKGIGWSKEQRKQYNEIAFYFAKQSGQFIGICNFKQ